MKHYLIKAKEFIAEWWSIIKDALDVSDAIARLSERVKSVFKRSEK